MWFWNFATWTEQMKRMVCDNFGPVKANFHTSYIFFVLSKYLSDRFHHIQVCFALTCHIFVQITNAGTMFQVHMEVYTQDHYAPYTFRSINLKKCVGEWEAKIMFPHPHKWPGSTSVGGKLNNQGHRQGVKFVKCNLFLSFKISICDNDWLLIKFHMILISQLVVTPFLEMAVFLFLFFSYILWLV